MELGLVCEGVTDHAVLENMLCGMLGKDEPTDFIEQLQPNSADTDGGWYQVFDFIGKDDFRDAFGFLDYIVIQVDTDVAYKQHFDVDLRDENSKTLKDAVVIAQKVQQRLIEQINLGEAGFYQAYQDRIIFAVSVHSLEIWLFKHFDKSGTKTKQISDGERLLAGELAKDKNMQQYWVKVKKANQQEYKLVKTYDNYIDLSIAFYKKKTAKKSIDALAMRDQSFALFKQQVDNLLLSDIN